MSKIPPKKINLKTGESIMLRTAREKDATALINYINLVIAETDFLTRGAGEFEITKKEEEKIIGEKALELF